MIHEKTIFSLLLSLNIYLPQWSHLNTSNLTVKKVKPTYLSVSLTLQPVHMKCCTQKHLFNAVTTEMKVNSNTVSKSFNGNNTISNVVLLLSPNMQLHVQHWPINDQCSLSYKNQSIDLHCESIDWFLNGGGTLVINGLKMRYIC